jgi:cob(I)alamin adenosyltransferase
LEAYGTVDEANCVIGVALALPDVDPRLAEVLSAIQNDLFDVGADLATPLNPPSPYPVLRVTTTWVTRLEQWCDQFAAEQPSVRSFLLPGGTALSAQLNVARTVTRRAERAGWAAAAVVDLNLTALTYLNRLSDLLFILGREANRVAGRPEVLWKPAEADTHEDQEDQ